MKHIMNRVLLAFITLITTGSLLIPVAFADEVQKQLVGTWKLTAWVVQVIGEDSREPYGPNPKGRLVITPEGHWIVVLTGANRRPAKTIDEKAALLDSMLAYSGKYRIEGDKITTRVDMSSNEIYTGANQDQTRFFKVEGDRLALRTPEIASAVLPGKKVVGTLTWERER
jgi:lipocalin-like protein